MPQSHDILREVLPIPDRKPVGLTTCSAKDPDTKGNRPYRESIRGLGRFVDASLKDIRGYAAATTGYEEAVHEHQQS
jgi:hypothetical protein